MNSVSGRPPGESSDDTPADGGPRLRLAFVPGATPAKWVRTWRDRNPAVTLDLVPVTSSDAVAALHSQAADIAILRLPVDREGLAVILLYEERAVVVVSRDHLLAALGAEESVALADLADDVVLSPLDDVLRWGVPSGDADAGHHDGGADGDVGVVPPVPGRPAAERPATTADAIELVAAGVGVLVVPQSIARLHHRKDITYRVLDGAPTAPVALAWVTERTTDDVEEFVGIVRGRTANSSRGARAAEASDGAEGRGARRESPGADGSRTGARSGVAKSNVAKGGRRSGAARGGKRGSGARGARRGRRAR